MMNKFNSLAEENEFKAKVLSAVAAVLGATVTHDVDNKPKGLRFAEDCEAAAWVQYTTHNDSFHIQPLWVDSKIDHRWFACSDVYPRPVDPSINVSASKTPERIAADIKRRFLPSYLEALKKVQAARDNHDNYITKSNSLAAGIAKAFGVAPRGEYGRREDAVERRNVELPSNLGGYGGVECSNDSASFKINSLPADKALKLAAFLKTL